MIISRIYGGLGNQMFQYAAGYSLARKLTVSHFIDLRYFSQDSTRKYELGNFILNPKTVPKLLVLLSDWPEITKMRLLFPKNKRGFFEKLRFIPTYKEMEFGYEPDFFKLPKNISLEGYFQSYQYFIGDNEIRNLFKFDKEKISKKTQQIANKIRATESVSVHVRRTDYVNMHNKGYFAKLTPQYYSKAMKKFNLSKTHFYIFSDDVEWVKTNLVLPKNAHIITGDINKPAEDLYLMSQAKHHIIANSSFSWWGAWLGYHSNQRVLAPSKWFGSNKQILLENLYPNHWQLLEVNK